MPNIRSWAWLSSSNPGYLRQVERSVCTFPSGAPSSEVSSVWSAILHLSPWAHLHRRLEQNLEKLTPGDTPRLLFGAFVQGRLVPKDMAGQTDGWRSDLSPRTPTAEPLKCWQSESPARGDNAQRNKRTGLTGVLWSHGIIPQARTTAFSHLISERCTIKTYEKRVGEKQTCAHTGRGNILYGIPEYSIKKKKKKNLLNWGHEIAHSHPTCLHLGVHL